MRRTLTLVKHARPEKLEGVDSHDWPLSATGVADVARLAELLRPAPAKPTYVALATSDEPKALETARLLAEKLAIPLTVSTGLREHDRTGVPLMRTADFVSAIAHFFARPNQLVLGRETARQSLKRLEKAIDETIAAHPDTGDLLIVSHGTVIALWLEAYAQLDAYKTWRAMGLPSYVSITWPACDVVDRMDQLPGPPATSAEAV